MKCPITGAVANGEVEELNINVDEIGDVPSLKEYKKLKKVMAMITKFYRDGSEKKRQVESIISSYPMDYSIL